MADVIIPKTLTEEAQETLLEVAVLRHKLRESLDAIDRHTKHLLALLVGVPAVDSKFLAELHRTHQERIAKQRAQKTQ
jgi:hypothetical protein